jgi:hypothetical protein
VHLLRCTACRITATVAPHKLTNIPISVQFVILYLISRNYKRVLEEQLGGHLLWLDVKHAGCLRLASAGAGLLNNTVVRVVLVAVVAVFVFLFAGHLLTTSIFFQLSFILVLVMGPLSISNLFRAPLRFPSAFSRYCSAIPVIGELGCITVVSACRVMFGERFFAG